MRLIDAEETIKAIEEVRKIMDEEIIENNRKDLINFVNGLNQACLCVEQQPTVEERPTGKWKYDILFPPTSCCSSTRITCTKCGYTRQRMDGEILNYCQNCGAKMKGEE